MDNINLLPWRETKRESINRKQMLCILISMVVLALLVISIKCYVIYLMNHQQRINQQLTHEIKCLNKKIKPALKWDLSYKRLLKKIAILDEAQKDVQVILRFFESLASLIPPGITLERIERNLDKITLVGCEESATHLPQLMRNILNKKEMKLYGIPEIQQSHTQGEQIENKFKLTFLLINKI